MAKRKYVYRYHVSEVHEDMLRYDHGYIHSRPPVDDRLSFPEEGIIVYKQVERIVYSKFWPSRRWASFGIRISRSVKRVPIPTQPMWTVRGDSRDSKWVHEVIS